MVAADEGALMCDFAEYYHIYEWRKLPARYAATLAAGLRPESRSRLKLSGNRWPMNTLLLATIADACRLAVWRHTRAAAEGKAPPVSLYKILFGKTDAKNSSSGFATGEEFFAWREKMMGGDANA